jgi:hypothetical protein
VLDNESDVEAQEPEAVLDQVEQHMPAAPAH